MLDHEEALAIQHITASVQRLGDDFTAATQLRQRIRRHPFLATGLGALAGFVGGPLILRGVNGVLAMTSSVPSPAARRPRTLPGILMASLRAVRARS